MDEKFIKEPEYLYVDLSGSFSLDEFKDVLKKIGAKVEDRVIMDGSKLQNSDLSYEIRYELVIAANEFLNAGIKYAIVWPEKDINNFIVSNLNRLGINIQIFPKLAKAKKWILSGS